MYKGKFWSAQHVLTSGVYGIDKEHLSMKNLLIIFLSFLVSSVAEAQEFKVVKISNDDLNSDPIYWDVSDKDLESGLYKIYHAEGKKRVIFPFKLESQSTDYIIKLISDLLEFEGDKRLSGFPIRCYNPLWSQIYGGDSERYSIQLMALFMINQLYFEDPFNYSPYPIIVSADGKQEATIDGELLKEAYKCYREWFGMVKKLGLQNAREMNLEPMKGEVKWYK